MPSEMEILALLLGLTGGFTRGRKERKRNKLEEADIQQSTSTKRAQQELTEQNSILTGEEIVAARRGNKDEDARRKIIDSLGGEGAYDKMMADMLIDAATVSRGKANEAEAAGDYAAANAYNDNIEQVQRILSSRIDLKAKPKLVETQQDILDEGLSQAKTKTRVEGAEADSTIPLMPEKAQLEIDQAKATKDATAAGAGKEAQTTAESKWQSELNRIAAERAFLEKLRLPAAEKQRQLERLDLEEAAITSRPATPEGMQKSWTSPLVQAITDRNNAPPQTSPAWGFLQSMAKMSPLVMAGTLARKYREGSAPAQQPSPQQQPAQAPISQGQGQSIPQTMPMDMAGQPTPEDLELLRLREMLTRGLPPLNW